MSYFGIIHEIWEVDYVTFKVPIFKCEWVDSNLGVWTNDLGFTLVDLNKMSDIDEPFIMGNQARQIFYVIDPANQKLSIVLDGRNMHVNDDEDCLDILETTSFSSRTIQDKVDDVTDDIMLFEVITMKAYGRTQFLDRCLFNNIVTFTFFLFFFLF